MSRYVLAAHPTDSSYIDIDQSNGGYPVTVPSIYDAKQFNTREDAARYVRVFASSRGSGVGTWPWTPVKVNITAETTEPFNPIELGEKFSVDTQVGQFLKMLDTAAVPYTTVFNEDKVEVEVGKIYIFSRVDGTILSIE